MSFVQGVGRADTRHIAALGDWGGGAVVGGQFAYMPTLVLCVIVAPAALPYVSFFKFYFINPQYDINLV